MPERKLNFVNTEWVSDNPDIKIKSIDCEGKRIRVLELKRGLKHPEWCETGHIGYVAKGELQIKFEDETVIYSEGDGIYIAAGKSERHIPEPISEKVTLFLVEEI